MKKVIYIVSIFIVLVCVLIIYKTLNKDNSMINKNNDIIRYELKTSEYFNDIPDNDKYFIDSVDELNEFYSIYSNVLDIDSNYLKDNSIFIQVKEVGTGGAKIKLSSVTFENSTVNFNIDEDYLEISTNDMAFWYLVAIIPNEKLSNLEFDEWKRPSDIELENYVFEMNNNKYQIITNLKSKTMQDDGGSYRSVYYQIDLENKIIVKVEEDYSANLGGTPVTKRNNLYVKRLSEKLCKTTRVLIEEILNSDTGTFDGNIEYYTILAEDYDKIIYNLDFVNDIDDLLVKFDNL